MIVSYRANPLMFRLTLSLGSVVATFTPKSTVPPLPGTESVGSATVRTGVVTDGVDGVVGVVGAVGVVGEVGDVGVASTCRPANVFTAPERFAARPDASLMLAPVGRLTPVTASAGVSWSVGATVVLKVSEFVPEPPT